MLNYMKSELYRVAHDRSMYLLLIILSGLCIFMNAATGAIGNADPGFRYATTSFAYSYFVASPMLFPAMGAVVAYLLFEGNRKNGSLKNTIAFGIPRSSIFIGQCIIALLTATLIMVIVLVIYVITAMMFLEPTGPVTMMDLISEIPAVYLSAAACLISAVILVDAFSKTSTGIIVHLIIWMVIPKIFFYAGLHFTVLYDIAMWMPTNFFSTQMMQVNTSVCITTWDTISGMARCILAGGIGVIVFIITGMLSIRKRQY